MRLVLVLNIVRVVRGLFKVFLCSSVRVCVLVNGLLINQWRCVMSRFEIILRELGVPREQAVKAQAELQIADRDAKGEASYHAREYFALKRKCFGGSVYVAWMHGKFREVI